MHWKSAGRLMQTPCHDSRAIQILIYQLWSHYAGHRTIEARHTIIREDYIPSRIFVKTVNTYRRDILAYVWHEACAIVCVRIDSPQDDTYSGRPVKSAGRGLWRLAKEANMFFHSKQLQYRVRVEKPDPVYAKQLQELIGGKFGEMTVMNQYL